MLGDHRELIDALTAEILLLREENSATQVFTCSPSGSIFSSEHVCMHKGFSWSCCWLGWANAITCRAQQQQWVLMTFVMPGSQFET